MSSHRSDVPATDPLPAALLVSVREQAELSAAISAGVEIVDLKEPRLGPLAPAPHQLWIAAADTAGRLDADDAARPWQLSAALGESHQALTIAGDLPAAFAFAKVGPSGCDRVGELTAVWDRTRQRLDPAIELVAVAYADWGAAQCVSPWAILDAAVDAGLSRVLIDTFTKDGRSTLDHLGVSELARLDAAAKQRSLWWVLAGSIRLDQLDTLQQHGIAPDCVGVRGDVCGSGRTSALCETRLQRWRRRLRPPQSVSPPTPNRSASATALQSCRLTRRP